MRVLHDELGISTKDLRGNSAVRKITDGKSAVDEDWFSIAARSLYRQKPGSILHLTTGLADERLCQRYASGEVRPPAYFLRALQRSDHGPQWTAIVLDGVPWWVELHRAADIGRKVLDLTRGE